MDWDRKFSTIIHETEANLDRVRRRLEAARNSAEPLSPGRNAITLSRENFLQTPVYGSSSKPTLYNEPPVWATVLEEKIASQNKTIETLTDTVVSLQNDRDKQRSTINELKETLNQLQERLKEKGVNLDSESKFQQLTQQTQLELQDLKQQVQFYKQNDSTNLSARSSVQELKLQVQEVKSLCHSETESAKRDLDHYKLRMNRLENNLMSLTGQVEDLAKKQHEMRSNMIDLTDSSKVNYKELTGIIKEKMHEVNSTRNEVDSLRAAITGTVSLSNNVTSKPVSTSSPTHILPSHSTERGLVQQPTQWRDLLSHSLSSISIDSSESSLSSGYLRRRSNGSNQDEASVALPGGLASDSDDDFGTQVSTPSSLSLADL